ncbi:error-prone DNA polymerase [Carnimonas bestiolae]|uniref:error-prone DNA polymerase n=1 Tax=Carnimonas bestiolae TaxID=3402172 RepID=UPI003EDB8655
MISTPAADYAELHCLSNFSFQRGASSADELFERAARLGYRALAITDEATLAGIVRAKQAAAAHGIKLIVGAEFSVVWPHPNEDKQPPVPLKLVLLVEHLAGYQRLCQLITQARRRADKGSYQLHYSDLCSMPEHNAGLCALWVPEWPSSSDIEQRLTIGRQLQHCFPERLWLALELHYGQDDLITTADSYRLADVLGVNVVAAGDVHMHSRGRRALQDVMTAVRHHCSVADAGWRLFANGERHLRRREALAEIYPAEALAETLVVAARCQFELDELRYQYPHEGVPAGHSSISWLTQLVEEGAQQRWPEGVTDDVRQRLAYELALIEELKYENYFLTVYDIVAYARSRAILCQGRGAAANSVVCYALGITELDPTHAHLLFERFISRERGEPPDIDVDFEHERREEVIQYIFQRYGRERAALTAVVSSYHAAGAIRDVARALGLPADQIDELADCCGGWESQLPSAERLAEKGFDAHTPVMQKVLVLAAQLIGFPRHLSQHPGGFVISDVPLEGLVPIENASMEARTVIQWDKDDLDLMGMLKIDVLALGMLSALRRCFDCVEQYYGERWTLATLPQEDAATYRMIQKADTVGVFQIESRAQMAMLPRLKPATFYDLVIQVSIVRPGPIQGGMVHPYLKRRRGEEAVEQLSPKLEQVFKRTLGVPLFQEQVMELAIHAAGYTPGEADQLRRSMAAWKRHGGLETHRERLREGMLARGYSDAFALRIFEQIKGFGSYGFPESHAASFALLTYASCWLKCHYPAAFACAVINSYPMGFYAPGQLLKDARHHGIEVAGVDVQHSEWECSLEPSQRDPAQAAIRMGFNQIRGFRRQDAEQIIAARQQASFTEVAQLAYRAGLEQRALNLLADANALKSLAGHRHQARWKVAGIEAQRPLFDDLPDTEQDEVTLAAPSQGQELVTDYAVLGTTIGEHPMALLRHKPELRGCHDSQSLIPLANNTQVHVSGLVIGRQRPGTASGVIFVTLEDEHGMVNVVVWRALAERLRSVLLNARLMRVSGRLECEEGVRHLIAQHFYDLSELLDGIPVGSRDFH